MFIAAKNLHYGLDFCPAFWDWLITANTSGKLYSIEKVNSEIHAVEDELSTWAAALNDNFFLPPDAATLPALATVAGWANSQNYTPAAVSTFLQIADYYLIAQAQAGGHTVVTHEVPSASIRKIKIPDASLGLRIKFATPFEMLRRERARFVLQTTQSDRHSTRAEP